MGKQQSKRDQFFESFFNDNITAAAETLWQVASENEAWPEATDELNVRSDQTLQSPTHPASLLTDNEMDQLLDLVKQLQNRPLIPINRVNHAVVNRARIQQIISEVITPLQFALMEINIANMGDLQHALYLLRKTDLLFSLCYQYRYALQLDYNSGEQIAADVDGAVSEIFGDLFIRNLQITIVLQLQRLVREVKDCAVSQGISCPAGNNEVVKELCLYISKIAKWSIFDNKHMGYWQNSSQFADLLSLAERPGDVLRYGELLTPFELKNLAEINYLAGDKELQVGGFKHLRLMLLLEQAVTYNNHEEIMGLLDLLSAEQRSLWLSSVNSQGQTNFSRIVGRFIDNEESMLNIFGSLAGGCLEQVVSNDQYRGGLVHTAFSWGSYRLACEILILLNDAMLHKEMLKQNDYGGSVFFWFVKQHANEYFAQNKPAVYGNLFNRYWSLAAHEDYREGVACELLRNEYFTESLMMINGGRLFMFYCGAVRLKIPPNVLFLRAGRYWTFLEMLADNEADAKNFIALIDFEALLQLFYEKHIFNDSQRNKGVINAFNTVAIRAWSCNVPQEVSRNLANEIVSNKLFLDQISDVPNGIQICSILFDACDSFVLERVLTHHHSEKLDESLVGWFVCRADTGAVEKIINKLGLSAIINIMLMNVPYENYGLGILGPGFHPSYRGLMKAMIYNEYENRSGELMAGYKQLPDNLIRPFVLSVLELWKNNFGLFAECVLGNGDLHGLINLDNYFAGYMNYFSASCGILCHLREHVNHDRLLLWMQNAASPRSSREIDVHGYILDRVMESVVDENSNFNGEIEGYLSDSYDLIVESLKKARVSESVLDACLNEQSALYAVLFCNVKRLRMFHKRLPEMRMAYFVARDWIKYADLIALSDHYSHVASKARLSLFGGGKSNSLSSAPKSMQLLRSLVERIDAQGLSGRVNDDFATAIRVIRDDLKREQNSNKASQVILDKINKCPVFRNAADWEDSDDSLSAIHNDPIANLRRYIVAMRYGLDRVVLTDETRLQSARAITALLNVIDRRQDIIDYYQTDGHHMHEMVSFDLVVADNGRHRSVPLHIESYETLDELNSFLDDTVRSCVEVFYRLSQMDSLANFYQHFDQGFCFQGRCTYLLEWAEQYFQEHKIIKSFAEIISHYTSDANHLACALGQADANREADLEFVMAYIQQRFIDVPCKVDDNTRIYAPDNKITADGVRRYLIDVLAYEEEEQLVDEFAVARLSD